MASGAAGGGVSTAGWIAGAGVVAAVGIAGLYYTGVLGSDPAPQISEPQHEAAPVTPKDDPESAAAETDTVTATKAATETATETTAQAAADASDPVPDSSADTGDEPAPEGDTTNSAPVLEAPEFDVVRVDPDGNTVIAGTGPAGASVTLYLDGAEQASTVVDRAGAFVSLLVLAPSNAPRVLTMVATLNGQERDADDQIILAPSPATVSEPDTTIVASEAGQADSADPVAEPKAEQADGDRTAASETPDTQAEDTVVEPTAELQSPVGEPEPEPKPEAEVSNTAPVTAEVATSSSAQVAGATQPSADVAAPEPSTKAVAQTTIETTTEPATEITTETATETTTPATPPVPAATTQDAPAAPVTVLRAGKDGVEVLQSGAPVPVAFDKVVLETIGYSQEGDVLLSGRAQIRSVIRVYFDNVAKADLITDADGRWSGKVEDITPGIYTMRLDELDSEGTVLSRLETPFKREAPEVLNPPKKPAVISQGATPDDVANNQPVAETPLIRAVTVQQGDTLWAISRERYGDGVLYVRLYEANREDIRDPDLIYPGQVFKIPE